MTGTAAVIVTYNRKDKLLRCIEAVCRQKGTVQPDIIIVDNNSSDGTEEIVRNYIKENSSGRGKGRIIYRNLRHNSGGAGGFCYGVRKAAESGYDYIWLMDDDCVPAEDALDQFLRFDRENPGYGFLSGKVLWKDGTLCEMNLQRETVVRDIRSLGSEPMRVEMASFVSLFIPVRVVRDVGLPVRQFFIWTDDWEYTRRISRKYPCWVIPSSEVMHDTEQNSGADIASSPDERIDRFRYLYRNDVVLYRREGFRGLIYETARLCVHAARIAASRNSLKEKLRRTGIMLRGTAEGLGFYPEPERAYFGRKEDA